MTPLDWHLSNLYSSPEQYLGYLTGYLNADSVDSLSRQLEDKSRTGWWPEGPERGWKLNHDNYLIFPGLPPLAPAASAYHLGERILVYPAGFVCIVQLSGAFSLGRVL